MLVYLCWRMISVCLSLLRYYQKKVYQNRNSAKQLYRFYGRVLVILSFNIALRRILFEEILLHESLVTVESLRHNGTWMSNVECHLRHTSGIHCPHVVWAHPCCVVCIVHPSVLALFFTSLQL